MPDGKSDSVTGRMFITIETPIGLVVTISVKFISLKL